MLLAGRPLWIKRVMSEYEICESETDRIEEYHQLLEEFSKEVDLLRNDVELVSKRIDKIDFFISNNRQNN